MKKIVLSLMLSLSVLSCNAGPILATITYGTVRLACFLPGKLVAMVTVLKSKEADDNKESAKATQIRLAGGSVSVVSTAGAVWGSHVVAAAAAKLALAAPTL